MTDTRNNTHRGERSDNANDTGDCPLLRDRRECNRGTVPRVVRIGWVQTQNPPYD